MTSFIRFLMCPPDHYEVEYAINPWMEGNIHKSSRKSAIEQWQSLAQVLKQYAEVDEMKPQKGWPDMVFTANAGLVLGNTVVLSRFLHKERQGEREKSPSSNSGSSIRDLPFKNFLKTCPLRERGMRF